MISTERPPYLAAGMAAVVVLVGYISTLAPTVTFWDAGELVASARILGIPHPPGTPLWVMLGHLWGLMIPFGDYAWRLNLSSAVFGAIAAGCWYLVAFVLSRRADPDLPGWMSHATGFAAALLTAFTFTNWQNAVEAEVYSVAMLTIGLASWAVVRWCSVRESRQGQRLLLVLAYLGAISIGNHLLALLIGPAVVALLISESWRKPLRDAGALAAERTRIWMLATTWLLLIALGLGSTVLSLATGLMVVVAAVLAVRRHQWVFVLAVAGIVVIGVSPYLFLYLRAQQGPFINEAAPATWDALLAVIRRAQYPVRTPLDDPTIVHGTGNPGRTFAILGYQLATYFQYFDWQWARSLGDGAITSISRLAATSGAILLGLRGAYWQWKNDRSAWWFVAVAFLTTGLGLVLYMNFKPGPSIGYKIWPSFGDHEVRERDYFFVVSFVVWAVWIAIGLTATVRDLVSLRLRASWAALLFALVLVPPILNARDASRRHGPAATLARDFSRALLNSVPPGGILFTWGDNDTFPLWHAQAVDGIRRDVTIVCLALAETPWYQLQLRDYTPDEIDTTTLPDIWKGYPVPERTSPIHRMDDQQILTYVPQLADRDYELPLPNGARMLISKDTPLYARDMLMLAVVGENAGKRPISWSITAARELFDAPVIQQGLVYTMPVTMPSVEDVDTSTGLGASTPMDTRVTRALMEDSWQFNELLAGNLDELDPTAASMAATLAMPFMRMAVAQLGHGDTTQAVADLRIGAHLVPDQQPEVELFISQLMGTPTP